MIIEIRELSTIMRGEIFYDGKMFHDPPRMCGKYFWPPSNAWNIFVAHPTYAVMSQY